VFIELITEEVVAKRALAESEARFRATFENAAVGIAHLSPQLRWLRANGTFCRIVGWPIDELVTKSLREISHRDDFAEQLVLIERLRLGKIDSYKLDKRFVRKDGAIAWGRLTVSSVLKRDGSADYFVHVLEDISAEKRAEDLLKHQADLLDQSHDAVVELQTDGRGIVYWNRGAERLYGYTAIRLPKRWDAEPKSCSTLAPPSLSRTSTRRLPRGKAGAANSLIPRATDGISSSRAALSLSRTTARCLRWRPTAILRHASVLKRN